jgi:TPR repeat protein
MGMSCQVETVKEEETYDAEGMIEALLRGERELVLRTARKFAEQGVADAQVMMGVLYETGLGVPKNIEEAIAWYQKAAAQEHPTAWSNLGTIYLLGLHGQPDKEEAARCYGRAKLSRQKNGHNAQHFERAGGPSFF